MVEGGKQQIGGRCRWRKRIVRSSKEPFWETRYVKYTIGIADHIEANHRRTWDGLTGWTFLPKLSVVSLDAGKKVGKYAPKHLRAMIALDRYRGVNENGSYTPDFIFLRNDL